MNGSVKVFRFTETIERSMRKNSLRTVSQWTIRIRQQCSVLFCKEKSGSDSVYTQTITEFQSQFPSHIFGKVSDRCFRCTVTYDTGQRTKSRFRTEVYDRTLFLFNHDFSKYHCRQYCTEQIQIHYFLECVNLQVKECLVRCDCSTCHITTGSIQQNINASIRFHYFHFVAFQNFFVHYIRIKELSFVSFCLDTFYQCFSSFFTSVEYHYFCTFFCKICSNTFT